jgi:hypothetical protein
MRLYQNKLFAYFLVPLSPPYTQSACSDGTNFLLFVRGSAAAPLNPLLTTSGSETTVLMSCPFLPNTVAVTFSAPESAFEREKAASISPTAEARCASARRAVALTVKHRLALVISPALAGPDAEGATTTQRRACVAWSATLATEI